MRIISIFALLILASSAIAHDVEHPELNDWFMDLRSKKGVPCCDVSDGQAVAPDDWKSDGKHYSVLLDGKWTDVPDEAVIEKPNLARRAMVWPRKSISGITILCFMPGSMT